MSIQIYNEPSTLKIVIDGVVKNTPKQLVSISANGDTFFLNEYGGLDIKSQNPAVEVTVPENVNAENLREIIAGYLGVQPSDADGNPLDIKYADGKLRTSSVPYYTDITKGSIANHFPLSKFGHNSAVAAAWVEVWDGERAYVYMGGASTLYISSSDDTDKQTYEVQGLDANWEPQTVTVVANGFTFVPLTGTWMRVFRAKNMGATDNAGDIYISDANTDVGGNGIPDDLDNMKAKITVGFNQTLMGIWAVPFDCTAFITNFYAGVGSAAINRLGQVGLYVRPFGGVFQIKKLLTFERGSNQFFYDFPLEVPARSDIIIKAIGSGAIEVDGGFDLWYEN